MEAPPRRQTLEVTGGLTVLGHLNHRPSSDPRESIYSGMWGYVQGAREYALVAGHFGLSIVDVTEPAAPAEVGVVPMAGGGVHRDVVVHEHYAYVAAQEGGDFFVIDLAGLPGAVKIVPNPESPDGAYPQFRNLAHTVAVADGYVYLNSAGEPGCVILDVHTDPASPKMVTRYDGRRENKCHDSLVRGNILYVAGENTGLYDIVDISDITRPTMLSRLNDLPDQVPSVYAHSFALSDDGSTLYAFNEGPAPAFFIYDVSDPRAPLLRGSYLDEDKAGVHNGWVKGNFLYLAYYQDGLVVLNIEDPYQPVEVAQYDTYPGSATDAGAWNLYPDLPSGNILLSDTDTGLYVLRFDPQGGGGDAMPPDGSGGGVPNICEGHCGGPGPGGASGCWCDASCAEFGDCCLDSEGSKGSQGDYVAAVCDGGGSGDPPSGPPDAPSNICSGYCGGPGPAGEEGCWCDDECGAYGDCCQDAAGTKGSAQDYVAGACG